MLILLGVLLAGQLALVVLLAREHRHAVEVIESVARSGSPDLRELVECIDRLCQRIQAPDVAVATHANAMMPGPPPLAVSMFDDDDHWQSKEALADLVEAQVTNGVAG
jgi:hypothetical protein